MKNISKTILSISLGLMSVFGAMNIAHASQDTASSHEVKASNAPSGYEKYGIGEVKADGQWVNDN